MQGQNLDREKLKKLVHYVCYRCHDPQMLGKTKLNKVLWYSDTTSYALFGKPVAGERYIKRQYGPVSESFLSVIRDLVAEGAIVERDDPDFYGFPKKEYIALKKPDISVFTPQEISLVEQIIDFVCVHHTAAGISKRTHDDIWEMAEIGEEIPYNTVFVARLGEITEEDVEWAREDMAAA